MEKINTEAWKKKHAKKMLKKKNIKFVYSIKTLKFNNIAVNKKEFTASKQAIALVIKVLDILLVTKNVILMDLYVLYCLKSVNT